MTNINDTKITPVAYRCTGFVGVAEGEQDYFSVAVYENNKGYGEGWFRLHDFVSGVPSDLNLNLYKCKEQAEQAVAAFKDKIKEGLTQ